jgi:hypothetical protein
MDLANEVRDFIGLSHCVVPPVQDAQGIDDSNPALERRTRHVAF